LEKLHRSASESLRGGGKPGLTLRGESKECQRVGKHILFSLRKKGQGKKVRNRSWPGKSSAKEIETKYMVESLTPGWEIKNIAEKRSGKNPGKKRNAGPGGIIKSSSEIKGQRLPSRETHEKGISPEKIKGRGSFEKGLWKFGHCQTSRSGGVRTLLETEKGTGERLLQPQEKYISEKR